MTIDLNAITRTRIPAKKIINQYKEGRRDFRNLDLRNYSFKKQDLRDADFSGSDIRGCSFEGATLENTNFSSVITGFSQFYWFNLFVSAVFGFLIWNYCLTFTAKYIEMITNPFKVAVEGILGIYVAEIFTIIAQAPLFFTVIIIILLIIAVPSFICDKKYLTNYVSSSTNSSLISGLFPSLLLSIIFIVTSILIEDLLHLRFDLIRSITILFILVVNTVLLYGFLRTLFLYKTEGTTFKNTNLNRAKFDQSSLKNCSFEGSSLDHASFSHAVLRKCSFTDANISYVNWRYSQFILLNYFTSHCNLLEKNIRTLCTTGNGNRGDYQNADLKQVDLSGIDLTGADLSGADLSNANLQNALLEGANLSNCKAGGTDFTGAIINNSTNFENFQINESTKFSDGFPQSILNEFITFEEKSDELNFAYHNLQNLSFKDQNLTGADFSGADIRGCSFEGAILENANFSLVKAGRSNQQLFYAILCIVALIISIGNIYFFGIEYVNNLVIVISVFIAAFWTNFINFLSLILINLMATATDKRTDSIKKSSNIQSTYRAYTDHFGNNFFWMPFWLVLMTLTGIESMRRFASVSTNGVIININSIFFLVLLVSFIFFLYRVVILAFLAPVGYSGTSFNKANLNHAIFNQANLKGCNFTHANLDNCNFERAIFIRSRFENTNLAYTNWEAAKFKGKLNHFSGYLINDKVRRLLITRNGRDSNFQEAYFEQVDLRNVDLSGSNLNKANFQNALLEGANLANAQALGTDFTGVIIKDTNFENLRIDSKTKFPDDFAEDILDKCILRFQNLNFSKLNLQNLSFKDLDLTGADFSGADIRGCSFEGATLENTNFSSVIAGRSHKQFLLLTLYIVITIILSGSLELLAIDYVNSHFSVFLRQFTGMMAVPFLWLTHLVVGLIVIAVAAGINLLIIFLLWRPKQNQSKSLEILNLTHFEYIKTVQVYDDFPNIGLCSGIMTISAIGSLFLLINSYSYTTVNTINIIASSLLLISFLWFLICFIYVIVTGTGTSFNHTILNNSTFYQANLGLCSFANANLDNCNFERANFTRVDFTNSSLIYTNWKGVKFGSLLNEYYGYLKNDNVRQLVVTRNGRDKNYRGLELTQLDLQGVDLSGADLRNADLSGSNLRNAKLNRTNLQNTKVLGTDFSEAVISNCNLENLLFDDDTKFPANVIIPHDNQTDNSVNLSNQVLDFSNRTLRNISYVGQNLEGANFSNSVIINCNFKETNLRKANFVNVRIFGKHFFLNFSIISCFIGVSAGTLIYINQLFIAIILLMLSSFLITADKRFWGDKKFSVRLLLFTLITNRIFVIISNFGKTNIFSQSGSLLLILICVYFLFFDSRDSQQWMGSDSFDNCNLDGANFSGSTLDKCDLRNAIIDHVDWSDTKFINCIFPANLNKKEIQELCSTRNGREKEFAFIDLKNFNLSYIDFTAANFSGSDLTNAHLKYACLEQANLSNVNAIGSDFTGATFTGACIENWTVGANTNFNNIKCEYIYLEQGQKERKPASGSFQEGDFEKIIIQYQKSLDILFRNGDDPEAFKLALPLMLELRKEDGYYFKSIENIGDGDILLRLAHNNPNPNKALAYSLFTKLTETITSIPQSARQTYQSLVSELAKILPKDAKQNYEVIETELIRLRNQLEITQTQVLQLTQEVQIQKETKQSQRSQSENDKIRRSFSLVSIAVENMFSKINKAESSGGDAIVGGIDNKNLVVGKNQTGVSGRDISNSTINQLQASSNPNAKKLAELLKQLQSTIEQSALNSDDKESAQEHISNIAQFANNQQSTELKKPAKNSLDALETVLRRVSGLFQLVKPIIDSVRTILL
ncbi:MAG: pentapeptide repeat-containing protein [Microcystis sp. M038S2]|uniref:pentapeptide repeat-containing protein n=1 Tax=unclassified Microcystis TaxID=2643300 RepID=UPI0025857073|nr:MULTISPECIES: pentapeptide repeat-containing protein [unclassified Microcystis]MCA2683862.1 pentapeptide repeat-containing protein [Microcystis sp. M046S2]MCA2706531.1 pentapeptide repeat-containing protein [Microcystis sp. M038S2]